VKLRSQLFTLYNTTVYSTLCEFYIIGVKKNIYSVETCCQNKVRVSNIHELCFTVINSFIIKMYWFTHNLINLLTIFNVFHVRALYHTKTLITNKCTKRVLLSIVTHSYMFRTCSGPSVVRALARPAECSRLQKQRSTQSTAHSHSTAKCNPSVTVTESSPWRWPSRVETCSSVLRLMIKLSLCICWCLVFLYPVYKFPILL
jgi:hypothetical protein